MEDQVEVHENCDCIIVHPNGQLQMVKECWCKVYHAFGQNIQLEDVESSHLLEDIYCYHIKNTNKIKNLPPNLYMGRKLKRNVLGPSIFYRKGSDLSVEKAKSILI